MPIDIDRLMKFEIPVVQQLVTPRDIALYALSVGLGRDPLDARQLSYVDPDLGPRMMPSMVLVLAHPGFWLAHPESGVDARAVLHAAQGFQILGRLPDKGLVESRTRVAELIDKGVGRAALLRTQTELRDGEGHLFATLDRMTFIRDGGGFGGSAGSPAIREAAPVSPPETVVDFETGREQALLYRLNGDLNPLHSDPIIARKARFEAPILHGLCTMGIATHALMGALVDYRADAIRSVRLRFSTPVYPGETIRTEIWKDGRFRSRVPARDVIIIEDGLAEVDASQLVASGV